MKYYLSIDSMWNDALASVLAGGQKVESRYGDTLERIGWSGTLHASQQATFLTNKRRQLDPRYASAEVLWYLSRSADVRMIEHYAPQYRRFAEPNSHTVFGAYGQRLRLGGKDLLQAAHRLMRDNPNTRQCVIPLWHASDLMRCRDVRDVPCTLYWQFIRRSDELHMVVSMRSNDLWLGFPYDVFAFTCFQRLMADEARLRVGMYTHHVGSMHLYTKDKNKALDAMKDVSLGYNQHGWEPGRPDVPAALACEERYRVDGWHPVAQLVEHSMLHDLVACCTKAPASITSPVLQAAYQEKYHADH